MLFIPWLSGFPFPRYNLTLKIQGQSWRSKVPQTVLLTNFLSVSYQGILSTLAPFVSWQLGLPFPRYNLALKIQGERLASRTASSGLISIVFHIRAYYRLPSLSFHHNRGSYSRYTIWPWKFKVWPWKFKVRGQGRRYPSQRSIQLTQFLFMWH